MTPIASSSPGDVPTSRRALLRGTLASSTALLLSGCALTPDPLSPQAVGSAAQAALAGSRAGQEPVTKPIDLAEAMARAVLYNLDHRVALLEAAVRNQQAVTAAVGMLPQVAANAGYAGRNEFDASYSRDLRTGKVDEPYSTSQDRDIFTSDLAASWNVLDFGLSYIRARQATDRTLIAQEQRRRILARVVEEVRAAYWRALAAEYLGQQMKELEAQVRDALEQARRLAETGQTPPVVVLTYQREIYDLLDRLQTIEADVAAARNQLAALMNLPTGTRFRLVRPAGHALPSVRGDAEALVREALTQRAEVREAMYDQRIAELDATAAILELLPGINLRAATNTTSNSYTFAGDWLSWGAAASWNLMRIVTYPARRAEVEASQDLRAMQLNATVATVALQVHVSRVRYQLAQKRAETLTRYVAVQSQLLERMKATATSAQMASESDVVRESLAALLARARRDMAIAEAQSAYAAILTSLGRDPYPEIGSTSLAEVAAAFRSRGTRAPAA